MEGQIRKAMEQGAFEDLPHQGAPLPTDDLGQAGEWGPAYKRLKDAGAAPPWVEADKEARARLAAIESLLDRARGAPSTQRNRDEAEMTVLVVAANEAIARVNNEAPTDRQHRRLLDPREVGRRLAAAFDRE